MGGTLRDPLLKDESRGGESQAGEACLTHGSTESGQERFCRSKSGQITGARSGVDVDPPSGGSRIGALLRKVWGSFAFDLNYLAFPSKAGLAAALCAVLCYIPGPLSVLNKNGMWAVVTADVVLEANVGLTFSKGVNRTLGTLAAAAIALGVNFFAPKFGDYEPYFIEFFVFLGAAVATMFKFRRPFKDRWNYAVAMSMITFHILILSKSDYSEKLRLPLIRLLTIVIGFLVASLVNLSVAPTYAGNAVNELMAKNFERAGNVMERCVAAYREGSTFEQVPHILAGKSVDDNIHKSFHEIVSADSEVDKLQKAVQFEPCHGKFFFGFPWDIYVDIEDNLRYTIYDVIALDSCLRAEIQAPMHLRRIFEDEFRCIAEECGQVFRLLGESIRTMRHVPCRKPMERAQEGALILQHKIAKYTNIILGEVDDVIRTPEPEKRSDSFEEGVLFPLQDTTDDFTCDTPPQSKFYHSTSNPRMEHVDSTKSDGSVKSKSRVRLADWQEDPFERNDSMARYRSTTVERIGPLSLIKFASLLIELVAKAMYVVSIVEELEIKACFEGVEPENSPVRTPRTGACQV